jgi:hypothetical protein
MIELAFSEFHEQRYREQQYCLYVVKNGSGDVLYVGISKNDVWERWFGWGGHFTWDGDVLSGESPVGVKIENHLPDSLKWKIQLWNLEDCLEFCSDDFPADLSEVTIDYLEPIMIRKLFPILNATYNQNPVNDTSLRNNKEIEHERLLDQSYKDIFDKE